MCGIFSILNNNGDILTQQFIEQQFAKGKGFILFGLSKLSTEGLDSFNISFIECFFI